MKITDLESMFQRHDIMSVSSETPTTMRDVIAFDIYGNCNIARYEKDYDTWHILNKIRGRYIKAKEVAYWLDFPIMKEGEKAME